VLPLLLEDGVEGELRRDVRTEGTHVEQGDMLDLLEHPNQERYSGQRVFVVAVGTTHTLYPSWRVRRRSS
jgi:hypothetical protein